MNAIKTILNYKIIKKMAQQKQRVKTPFLLRYQSEKPHRFLSQNRVQFKQQLRSQGTFVAKRSEIQNQLWDHHIVQKNMRIQGLLKKYHALCIHYKIPQFYSYFFMLQLVACSEARIQDAILKESHQIKQRKSHFNIIKNSISARQACLRQLARCLQNLFNNQTDQSALHFFREEVQHFRKLTVFVIQHIKAWKQSLLSLSAQTEHIQFMYKAQNYLMTILNDNQFIFKSFLSKHLHFSHKNDPFIMRPQVQGADSKFLTIFQITQDEKHNYIALLRFLADERAASMQKSFFSKQDKIRQIQDIYMTKHPQMGSSILIRKIQNPSINRSNEPKQIDFINNQNHVRKPKNILQTRNKRQHNPNIQKQEDPKQQEKRKQMSLFLQKNDKIRRIKAAFGQGSLINPKNFRTARSNFSDTQNQRAQSLSARGPNSIMERQEMIHDYIQFQEMMRRKQMRILQDQRIKGSRVLKPIERRQQKSKLFDNSKGVEQLEKIFNQLQTQTPQKLKQYSLLQPKTHRDEVSISKVYMSSTQSPLKLKKIPNLTKTLLQHNQQVVVQLRNRVIKQIQHEKEDKQRRERERREEQRKIQQILNKKMDQQVLRALKSEKQKFHIDGKEQLASQFKSKQLFDYEDDELKKSKVRQLTEVQQQLRREMQLKWLRDVQTQLRRKVETSQMDKQKNLQQQTLSKEYEQAKRKQYMEKRFQEIQREQRAKAMKRQIEMDQQRKRQIQQQMRKIIEKQKERLQQFTIHQKTFLESEMRQAMKLKLLETLKKQRQEQDQSLMKQREKAKNQQDYRQQVRIKLEKQFQVQKQMQIVRRKQQKSAKVKVVSEKLDYLSNKMQEIKGKQQFQKLTKIKQLQTKQRNQKQMKMLSSQLNQLPDLRESAFSVKRISDHHKKQLRQQFQNELFSFRNPQFYEKQKPDGQQFFVKDFKSKMNKDNFLQNKMSQIQEIQRQNQEKNDKKITIVNLQRQEDDQQDKNNKDNKNLALSKLLKRQSQQSNLSEVFVRFSQQQQITNKQKTLQSQVAQKQKLEKQQNETHRLTLGMSQQQYKIYLKKKKVINQRRDWTQQKKKKYQQQQRKKVKKIIQDFQILEPNPFSKNNFNQQSQFDPMQINFQEPNKQIQILQPLNQGSQKSSNPSIIKEEKNGGEQKQGQKQFKKLNDQQQRQQMEQVQKLQKPQENYKSMSKTIKSNYSDSPSKRFLTSESQQSDQDKFKSRLKSKEKTSPFKKSKLKLSQVKNIKTKQKPVQKDFQQQQDVRPVQIQKRIAKQNKVKLRMIPQQKLRQFIDEHFENLPRIVKKTNFFRRQDLYKQIIKSRTFAIIQTIKNSLSIGLGIAIHNTGKKTLRSFDLIHVGPYEQQDYLQVLLSTSKYIFQHDPCEQVTFSNIYDKQVTDQNQFIKKFQRKFDPYGALFQKKIFNTQFERKYVLRRMVGMENKIQKMTPNYGSFSFLTQLFAAQNEIKSEFKFPYSGQRIGTFGMLGLYLSQFKQKQPFEEIISVSDYNDKFMKHLCKMVLNLKLHQTKIRQVNYKQYPNIFQMNIQLVKQGKDKHVLHCTKQSIETNNRVIRSEFKQEIPLFYQFFTSKAKFQIQQKQYESRYIRFKNDKQYKSFALKSNKFSSLITVLPMKNQKYKLFILDSEQYDGLNKNSKTPLDIYLKLYFANIQSHKITEYEHIWIPEIKTKQSYQIKQIQVFNEFGIYRDELNFSYVDYIGNSLKTSPTHRDLFVNPPFIIGLLDVQIEKATEGSPFYVRRVDLDDLLDRREVQKIIKESD